MPVRTGVPRTTHTWLKPLYDALDAALGFIVPSGASGIPNAAWFGRGVPQVQIGNATGVIGMYGATGITQLATGGNLILSATYLGTSGFGATLIAASGVALSASGMAPFLARFADNGGSGTPYTHGDVVSMLKRAGIAPQ